MVGWHVAAGALVLVIAFFCFAIGWVGGGDAKIAAATALWFGFDQLFPYLAIASVFGGALYSRPAHGQDLSAAPASPPASPGSCAFMRRETGIPYGIALAAAALVVYPASSWMAGVPV